LLDPESAENNDRFEEELGQAAQGDWEKLGLDPPEDLVPATIEEFRNGSG
jgi:hypothetical protein